MSKIKFNYKNKLIEQQKYKNRAIIRLMRIKPLKKLKKE